MIVLDTNVVSELTRTSPAPQVINWLDRVAPGQIFITSVTVGEMLYGVMRLPTGRRKATLATQVSVLLTTCFGGQALAFTAEAATEYADIVVSRETAGVPIPRADAQIAAICRLNGADLATRNVRDFTGTGVRIVDPWAD